MPVSLFRTALARAGAWWASVPLRGKGLAVVALPVAALVAATATFYLTVRRTADLAAATERAVDQRGAARGLLITTLEAETGIRGFLLTERIDFLEPYNQAVTALPIELDRLEALLDQESSQTGRLNLIRSLVSQRLDVLHKLRREESPAVRDYLLIRGKETSDALRGELEALVAEQDRRVAALTAEAHHVRGLTLSVIAVAVPLGILGGLLAMLLFTTGVVRRTQRLEAGTEQLARGEPVTALPGGGDEIGRLGRAMEQASELLRESRSRIQALLESANDAIVSADERGVILSWNDGARRIFGYEEKEIVGWPLTVLMPERYHERHRAGIERVRAGGDHRVFGGTLEFEGLRKDGTEFPLELSLSMWERSGRPYYSGIMRDITERKRLERLAAERATDLERSNRELELFASVASHDLQEPLRVVGGYAELLERRYRDKLDGDADEFIGYIVQGVARMQRLISDLLTYSRVGTRGVSIVPTDLKEAVDQAVANLEVAILESRARVTLEDLPTLPADGSQLAQLFQNLIGNAIKFRGKNGTPEVHVGAERRNGEWQLSVRDNGIGIEPEYRERIFQIFQRLHGRDEYPGTGIGLALCKKIVERHGGRIWVESEPGNGTEFLFTLPAKGDPHDHEWS